jgi:hypothetical protein
MVIGGVHYTAEQLCVILKTQGSADDGLFALAHQIIAARLNIATGADPTDAQAALDAADLLNQRSSDWCRYYSFEPNQWLTNVLRAYNEGETGPGACEACDPGGDD